MRLNVARPAGLVPVGAGLDDLRGQRQSGAFISRNTHRVKAEERNRRGSRLSSRHDRAPSGCADE
jgi:hypothetical protein